ncbi:MAG: isoleucine--tRNA ligase, partial [Pseudomonadota bacterium]
PEPPSDWYDADLAASWSRVFEVRRVVTGALEIERKEGRIGSSLESAPTVYIASEELLKEVEAAFPADLFITSHATLIHGDGPGGSFTLDEVEGVAVVPAKAEGIKCERSWKYFDPDTAKPGHPHITRRDADAVEKWEALQGA